jgi:uncharacterized protein YdeI (YjbR/CyaY-like superfamily)
MSATVEEYVASARLWPAEIEAIRPILIGCGLDESIKWGKPCYSHDGKNILILQEMKDFLSVMFFKGALLSDPEHILQSQGENSRSALRICLTSVGQVKQLAPAISDYIAEAIDVEASGARLGPAPEPTWVAELQQRLDGDAAFRAAFDALTPGRRREYNLHFGGAKKQETRQRRIDDCAPAILAGKGLRDR